jgi:hypothetical protein
MDFFSSWLVRRTPVREGDVGMFFSQVLFIGTFEKQEG